MRRAARRDENDNLLAHTARSMGAWMVFIGQPVDWLCYHRGRWYPVEIKRPDGPRGGKRGKYTEAQKKFIDLCKANNAPVYTWKTVEDVLTCLNPQPKNS